MSINISNIVETAQFGCSYIANRGDFNCTANTMFYAIYRKLTTDMIDITRADWSHATSKGSSYFRSKLQIITVHNNGRSLAVVGADHSVDGSVPEPVLIR